MSAKDWVPLLQSLVWPVFLALFLIVSRRQIADILAAIQERIAKGAAFEAGPSGIKLGPSDTQKLASAPPETRQEKEKDPLPRTAEGDVFYVVHWAEKAHTDREQRDWYSVAINLDSDDDASLDKVQRVVYHLHPTFPQPDLEVTNRQTQFEHRTLAWGQFMLTADVYLRGQDEPVRLYRYVNL